MGLSYNEQRHQELKTQYFGKFFDRLMNYEYYGGDRFANDSFAIKIRPGVNNSTYNGVQVRLCCKNDLLGEHRNKARDKVLIEICTFGFFLDTNSMHIVAIKGGDFNHLMDLSPSKENDELSRNAQLAITKILKIKTKEFCFLLASLMALHMGLGKVYMVHEKYTLNFYTPKPGKLRTDQHMAQYFKLHNGRGGFYRTASEIVNYLANLPQDHREKLFEAMDSLLDIKTYDTQQLIFRQSLRDKYAGQLIGLLRDKK